MEVVSLSAIIRQKTLTIVATIIPQQRAPLNRSQENAGLCSLCFTKGLQDEECPVALLQVRLTLLKQLEINKNNLPYNLNWSPPLEQSPYYWDPINASHRSSTKPIVAQCVNSPGIAYQAGSSLSRLTKKKYGAWYSGRPEEKNIYNQ